MPDGRVHHELAFCDEALSAVGRFGPQTDLSDAQWLSIVLEELAECGRVLNDDVTGEAPADIERLREELVQTGAMVLRWMWVLDERGLS